MAAGRRAQPGALRFVDENGDGVVNTADKTVIGNALGDYTGGFSSRLRYGAAELSTVWAFSQGNQAYNFTKQELYFANGRQNAAREFVNRWRPSNSPDQNARAETQALVSVEGFTAYDLWVEDASFLRMRNLTLSMEVPVDRLRLPLAQRARLYVSGQNLLTFTDYTGYDPEVNVTGNGATQNNVLLGFDYSAYPAARTYTVGLNLGF